MPAVERDYPDEFVSSVVLGAAELNQMPWGCIKAYERTNNTTGTTTIETVIEFDITVPDGRRQRITASATVRTDITGGVRAALYVDGVQVQRRNIDALEGGALVTFELAHDVQLDAGTYVIGFSVGPSGVAGNEVTAIADGEDGTRGVSTLYVDDVGPALEVGS